MAAGTAVAPQANAAAPWKSVMKGTDLYERLIAQNQIAQNQIAENLIARNLNAKNLIAKNWCGTESCRRFHYWRPRYF